MFRAKLQLDLFRLRAVQCRFVVLTFWSKTSLTTSPSRGKSASISQGEVKVKMRCQWRRLDIACVRRSSTHYQWLCSYSVCSQSRLFPISSSCPPARSGAWWKISVLSCAYNCTEEIINQSTVDTRLTREDGHLHRHTSARPANGRRVARRQESQEMSIAYITYISYISG